MVTDIRLPVFEASKSWDVIVVGGGTAGAIAAISAARAGAQTLGGGAVGSMGGSGNNAPVTPLVGNASGGGNPHPGPPNELNRRFC